MQHFCHFLLESVTQKNDDYSSPDEIERTRKLLRCTKTKKKSTNVQRGSGAEKNMIAHRKRARGGGAEEGRESDIE